jgi:hypothetical protein
MKITDTDSSFLWAAALIEGEGCFVISKDKRSNYVSCKIQLEMTDKDVIDRLHGIIGGRVHENNAPSKKAKFPNAKDSWRLVLTKQEDVFNALLRIMPFLGQRRLTKAKEMFAILEPKVCL